MVHPSPTLMATVLVFLKVLSRRRATIESVAPVSSTARKTSSPICRGIQKKNNSSSSEPPPYSSGENLTSTPAAMRDLVIQASRLFLELFPSGEALSPCGRFLGSPAAGGGVAAGADERLWGLAGPLLPPPLPPPFPLLSPFGGFLVRVWVFWRSVSCRLSLSLSRLFM